jgi:adenylate cyclase
MLEIALHNARQHQQFRSQGDALVLARAKGEPSLWIPVDAAKTGEADALVEIAPDGKGIALAMAGCEGECYCGRKCGLTGNCRLEVPARFSIDDTQFAIFDATRLSGAVSRPLDRLYRDEGRAVPSRRKGNHNGPSASTLSRWFSALGTLNHWTSSLQELYVQAARCAVEAIGLDGAMVLRRRDNDWEIAASHLPRPELGIHCDVPVLDALLKSPETLFHGKRESQGSRVEGLDPERRETNLALDPRPSTLDLSPAVVVSPLRNRSGRLVGAIYGYRSIRSGNSRKGIRYLEANLVELLAGAVSEGIARLEKEAVVDRRRALAEQSLFAVLDHDARRLAGEQREVTLLFADLRGFTQLSAQLAPEELYELLGHVMDCLTAAVMDHDGLVIDYYGDGLAAMWNAPADQASHPELACRAALRMLESVPDVAADWSEVLAGRPLKLGIGVHTGLVQVGNAGSRRRIKYGPRGTNVHLASRVEGAAKKLGMPLVVSEAAAKRLSNRLATFRMGRFQLAGIEQPVNLYGVCAHTELAGLSNVIRRYETALLAFESGNLQQAVALLNGLCGRTDELPAQFLAQHIEEELGRAKRRRRADELRKVAYGVIPLDVK